MYGPGGRGLGERDGKSDFFGQQEILARFLLVPIIYLKNLSKVFWANGSLPPLARSCLYAYVCQYSNMALRANFYIWRCFLCIQVSFGIT